MDEKPVEQNPIKKDPRYVIKAKTQAYYDAVKKLYKSGLTRKQLHKIMDLTKGNIYNLRVSRIPENNFIWFAFKGIRYDLKPDGSISKETKIGTRSAQVPAARKVTCKLCQKEVPIAYFETYTRCPTCGCKLVRYTVIRR